MIADYGSQEKMSGLQQCDTGILALIHLQAQGRVGSWDQMI